MVSSGFIITSADKFVKGDSADNYFRENLTKDLQKQNNVLN